MGFFSNILKRKEAAPKAGGMEDYMMLISVYFEASLASNLGINKLGMLPELRTNDNFFREVDASIRKNCRKLQDVQPYMAQFQAFCQDLMMLIGNLMKLKLRLPSFMKKALYTMTEKTINDVLTKNDFTDPGVMKTVLHVRQYQKRLGFSSKWMTDFVFQVVLLSKKEPRVKDDAAVKK